jgi:hypothetical protein
MGQKPIEGSTKIAGRNFERAIGRERERANGPNGVERMDARNNPSLGASESGLVGGLSAGEMAEWSKAHPC